MLYAVVNGTVYEARDSKGRIPEAAKVSKAVAKWIVKNLDKCETKVVGKAKFYIGSPPKEEPKTQDSEVDIFEVAGSLKDKLPFDCDVKREGTWLWVYGIAKSDKESHEILKAHGLSFAKGRKAWMLKPNGKKVAWKGYRPKVNTDYEVEAL